MKITRKKLFRYGLWITLILILSCIVFYGAIMQPSKASQKSFGEFIPTPEYQEAEELYADSFYKEALAKYQEIAKKNLGTALAAECQGNIACLYLILEDEERAIQEYEDMIRNYPGTAYEFGARAYIIDVKYSEDFDTWLKKNDELATSVGGKSIYEIIGLRSPSNRGSAQDIPADYRNCVAATYSVVAAAMGRYKATYGKDDPNKLDQSYKLISYVRQNFPTAPCGLANRTGTEEILSEWGFRGTGTDKTPPTIKTITPEYNNVYLIWRRPIIRVFMYDGDINQSQIDLANLEFKLDGVDLKDKMKTKIVTLRPRNPHDAKKIVEKIFIWYRPEKPLTRGLHTILVNAKDYAGNSSSAMCTFKITTPRKAGEDVE